MHPSCLYFALKDGNVEEMMEILKNNPNLDVNSTDENCALYTACEHGYDAVVSILLAHPDIDVNLRSELGVAPFMVAGRYGYTTCFRICCWGIPVSR